MQTQVEKVTSKKILKGRREANLAKQRGKGIECTKSEYKGSSGNQRTLA